MFQRQNAGAGGGAPVRHVLITGTSTGIGRACALRLAKQGFAVWAGVRTVEDGRDIEKAGKHAPVAIRSLQMDITDLPAMRAAEKEIRSQVGAEGLCGLVNNAGICAVGPVECVSLKEWRAEFEVNFFGAIAMTQIMLPLLRVHQAGGGKRRARIVNMGSITGEISTPLFGAYSASKFALRAMNDALRLELWAEGIRVCLIVPGTIQSEIWGKEKEGVKEMKADSEARRIYGRLIDRVSKYVFACAKKALPADRVAEAVERCLTSARPGIEYRVGWEAVSGSWAKRLIPGKLFDFMLGRTMGVPR
jgi:NAD(P)-dependent dehydrogenase (short-subunit alcohol dehydrogenase family)